MYPMDQKISNNRVLEMANTERSKLETIKNVQSDTRRKKYELLKPIIQGKLKVTDYQEKEHFMDEKHLSVDRTSIGGGINDNGRKSRNIQNCREIVNAQYCVPHRKKKNVL